MTRFHFALQRVLDFRQTQFQIAESEYRNAAEKLRAIQARQAALDAGEAETRKRFANLAEADGRDLAPLPGWYRRTDAERGRLREQERAAAQELEKRRAGLIEAQRAVRLLEKLHENRQREWQAAFDKELEELAADTFRGSVGARLR